MNNTETKVKSNYIDDDELFLENNDEILAEQDALKFFQQSDNVISYEIINFYNDKGKPRNRASLLNEPPLLRISSSDESVVDFALTKEFVKSLKESCTSIDRAYVGLAPKQKESDTTVKDKFNTLLDWIKKNKFKSGFFFVFVLFMVVMSVINF